jgi:hypothetical protein
MVWASPPTFPGGFLGRGGAVWTPQIGDLWGMCFQLIAQIGDQVPEEDPDLDLVFACVFLEALGQVLIPTSRSPGPYQDLARMLDC